MDEYIPKKSNQYQSIEMYIREYSRIGGFKESNDKLEIYKDIGLYMQSYAEFIVIKRYYHLGMENLNHFTIGDQKIEIGSPSNMFKVIFKYLEENSDFHWDQVNTIKLFNIAKDKAEEYLNQVLFLLEFYKPWYFQIGHKSTYDNCHLKNLKIFTSPNSFEVAAFQQPICYYNEAIKRYYSNSEDETAFLYFYKVIEFFFFINRKNEIVNLINSYSNNITELLKAMNEIYRTEEKQCLLYILRNELLSFEIKKLVYSARKEKIIAKRTVESLARGIYSFRNSIAHGKGDNKYQLRLPYTLKPDTELILWNKLMKQLSLKCIVIFCYNNNLER